MVVQPAFQHRSEKVLDGLVDTVPAEHPREILERGRHGRIRTRRQQTACRRRRGTRGRRRLMLRRLAPVLMLDLWPWRRLAARRRPYEYPDRPFPPAYRRDRRRRGPARSRTRSRRASGTDRSGGRLPGRRPLLGGSPPFIPRPALSLAARRAVTLPGRGGCGAAFVGRMTPDPRDGSPAIAWRIDARMSSTV